MSRVNRPQPKVRVMNNNNIIVKGFDSEIRINKQIENALVSVIPSNCTTNSASLNARVTALETSVASLDVVVANHESRITTLESEIPFPPPPFPPYPPYPYPPPYPGYNYPPVYPFSAQASGQGQAQSGNMHMQAQNQSGYPQISGQQTQVVQPKDMAPAYPYPPPFPPAPFPPFPPAPTPFPAPSYIRYPPIIPNGYNVYFNAFNYYYYMEPTSSPNVDVYNFHYSQTLEKWIYVPCDPINRTIELLSTPNHPIFYYAFVPSYGWGLIPDTPSFAADIDPWTITNFQYIFITGYGYCYVPLASPPTPTPNPDVCTSYDKMVSFNFNYYNPYNTYYYDWSTTTYGYSGTYDSYLYNPSPSSVYSYPFSMYSIPTCKTVPLTNGSVGYLLPDDNKTYEVTITAKLRINKYSIEQLYPNNIYPSTFGSPNALIDGFLQGGSLDLGQKVLVELLYLTVNQLGSVINTSTASTITMTQLDLKRDPSDNTKVYLINNTYHETNDVLINTIFSLIPDPNSVGRRVLSFRTNSNFSVVEAVVNLIEAN